MRVVYAEGIYGDRPLVEIDNHPAPVPVVGDTVLLGNQKAWKVLRRVVDVPGETIYIYVKEDV